MSIDVMKQALEALERGETKLRYEAITALRAAIEQAQEPVAWMGTYDRTDLYYRKPPQADVIPLYTAPPQRQWQGLTQREIDELWDLHHDDYGNALSATGYERAIEAKLRERNA